VTAPGPDGKALRRHHKRIQGMLDDPECHGELLALGVSLAFFVDFEMIPGKTTGKWGKLARRALDQDRYMWHHLRRLMERDIRRYDHTADSSAGSHWSVICGAPMIRRQGPCGTSATDRRLLVDHDTGRQQYIGACSRKEHKQWMETTYDRNRRGEERATPPRPAANTGGVLARHLPEVNWDAIYLYYDPRWTPPPEESPWQRPTLSLHLGDAEPGGTDDRPQLAVVVGAGEGIAIDGPQT
jgi:hypothetical protein